ncbi:50S ribosomal protein L15 [Candidatus Woesebacteria bacterium RIFCSPHIGHO2_12_FULL_46_16]|uniref:Large ribosomal subunit protein uL15 n=3 Tax=Microgenomates group TaxID=1794810 RepID=A0A0H4TX64_9BACT|nr:50S ribosomal protein L15 [uncultured Microgenomates bacterium Rifle_16ft_4_minimus_37906]AKQ05579.1 50S ribosomal protein L15 [uncultured Microgenomates bacterium Rifle_16ft_4_minimus_24682]OGM57952.1 MAG: 50S ribosomal protein L15 [Candidatus Woesebacteria bacterium RIFCSPHIGHO2_12_FULL_46_16]
MAISLPKIVERRQKRVGRGIGSGKGGHTVGRGQKGQKSRSHIGILFEGMKMKKSLIKKLPLQRGKDKNRPHPKPVIVKLEYLNLLPAGSKVSLDLLVKEGIVKSEDAAIAGVKILGDGDIKKKLTIEVPISGSAAKKIEKAGGKVSSE